MQPSRIIARQRISSTACTSRHRPTPLSHFCLHRRLIKRGRIALAQAAWGLSLDPAISAPPFGPFRRRSFSIDVSDDPSASTSGSQPEKDAATSASTFSNSSTTRRGLFSIAELQTPSDFVGLAGEAIHTCNGLRSELESLVSQAEELPMTLQQAVTILYRLDEISKTVCNVIDAAELCRSVHAAESWRDAASRAFTILSDYIAELNADASLYRAVSAVTSSTEVWKELSTEDRRLAVLLQAEFERDGIHLPVEQRDRVRQLQNQLTELETLFSRNLIHSKKEFLAEAAAVERVIPQHVLVSFGIGPANEAGQMTLNNDPQILQTLTKYSADPELRKQAYMESMTAVPENLPVLDALVQRRQELATTLGFESYADRFLRDKMAGNQQTVLEFLQQLLASTKPAFQQEMELLSEAKQKVEPNFGTIEPWDVAFYVGLLKARDGFDINAVSQYLTVHNCLESMKVLVWRLFGIDMREEEMTDEERWDVSDTSSTRRDSDARMRRFVFTEEDGRSLGTMYLDLFPRQGKYGHAAHFTVRCGCVSNGPEEPPEYQLPIIALVCNLSATGPYCGLTHAEVETVFHEFGHALHSLLSRTKFQHMSGTRAAMDFVETPSNLIENFVWDSEFLKILAVHHTTGESIPHETVQKLRKSRNEFSAIERMNQILYAHFDQKLFGVPDPTRPSTTEIFASLHREHGVPYAEGTHWHSRFGHLVTYGAGYYGYLYSQVFAGDIWKHCFEGNSLSRKSGDQLWHKMLIHGGAKDPKEILTDLLGRQPKVDFLVQK